MRYYIILLRCIVYQFYDEKSITMSSSKEVQKKETKTYKKNFNLFHANLLLRRNFLNYLKSRSCSLHSRIIAYQT